ncbi:unnamed protein product [marine sediment metagenome]|uniref:Uncharacterized protein n=1 Tax=marine sediment metagenome TaxID=412755 RepID=X1IM99_9ZZZZ
MLFKINRNVPANTPMSSPDFQKLSISKGTIIEWMLHMPEECADLMQLRVEYHNTQILPFSGSTWIYGMFEPTVIKDNILVDDGPYALDIYAFNLDDSYSHEYNIHCNIEPKKAVKIAGPGYDFKAAWDRLFGGGG